MLRQVLIDVTVVSTESSITQCLPIGNECFAMRRVRRGSDEGQNPNDKDAHTESGSHKVRVTDLSLQDDRHD